MARVLARLGLVEVDDDGRVETGRREQLELLVEIGQQLRRRFGPHDDAGWRSNVITAERAPDAAARSPNGLDDRLMPAMHTVVCADAQHGALALPRRRVEVGDELHEVGRYPRFGHATKR